MFMNEKLWEKFLQQEAMLDGAGCSLRSLEAELRDPEVYI